MNVKRVLFQDALDSSRFLRIAKIGHSEVVARVYFGKRGNLSYHGLVTLPKRLFYPDVIAGTRQASSMGFNAVC